MAPGFVGLPGVSQWSGTLGVVCGESTGKAAVPLMMDGGCWVLLVGDGAAAAGGRGEVRSVGDGPGFSVRFEGLVCCSTPSLVVSARLPGRDGGC